MVDGGGVVVVLGVLVTYLVGVFVNVRAADWVFTGLVDLVVNAVVQYDLVRGF